MTGATIKIGMFGPLTGPTSIYGYPINNGAIAVSFVRPSDYQGLQFKGRFVGARPSTDADRHLQERYRAAFFEPLLVVGVARCISKRYA